MEVEEKCSEALALAKELLSSSQFKECHELIGKHGEWLLGLESVIYFIVQKNIHISPREYEVFHQAFIAMEQQSNERLSDLKLFVRPEPTTKEKRILAFAIWHINFEIKLLIIFIVVGILYALFN
jgi:hypothetical protein